MEPAPFAGRYAFDEVEKSYGPKIFTKHKPGSEKRDAPL